MPEPGLTAEEIAQQILALQQQVRSDELALMQAQVDVKKLESQGADGVLKSTVSGVVGTVGDPLCWRTARFCSTSRAGPGM